jgi:SAM-dependent methyltransferase
VTVDYRREPWEHPDWYDLHDDAFTAGVEREPEHYRELVLALPALDRDDHLVDIGCGTGKAACYIADVYPSLGRVTLVEPNQAKLSRAHERIQQLLPDAILQPLSLPLGEGSKTLPTEASLVVVGSVLMPVAEMRGGTQLDAMTWLTRAAGELRAMLAPGGWLYALETLGLPWTGGELDEPVRRLDCVELIRLLTEAGFQDVEVVYRFRDRVVVRGIAAS